MNEENRTPQEKKEIESPVKSGMSEMTRGLIIGVTITALIALVIICLVMGQNNKATSSSGSNNITSESSDALISFYEYFERSEPTLIVFASSNCGYCSYQQPIVESIGEKFSIDYLWLEYQDLSSDDEINTVINALGIKGSTPTSVIVKNGQVLATNTGFVEADTYVEFLISGGILESGTTYDSLTTIDYDKFKELLNGNTVSVVLFDQYMSAYTTSLEERSLVDSVATENNIKAYYFPASFTDDDEVEEFKEALGKWGYSTEAYKESQAISVPLLMFVGNGKIIVHQEGTVDEAAVLALFKEAGLIK